MAADYEAAARTMAGQVNPIAVDCLQFRDICNKYAILGYPTLRLYMHGQGEKYVSGPRTAPAMLEWIVSKNAFQLWRPTQDGLFKPAEKEASFLYLPAENAPAAERELLDAARKTTTATGEFMLSTDAALRTRFKFSKAADGTVYNGASSAILMFRDGAWAPHAVFPLARVASFGITDGASAVDRWLKAQASGVLTELTPTNLQALMHNRDRVSVAIGIIGGHGAEIDAQGNAMLLLAEAWAASSDVTLAPLKFAWVDATRFPDLLAPFKIQAKATPQLVLISPTKLATYTYGAHSFQIDAAMPWLRDVTSGRVEGVPFGTMLDRTLSTVSTQAPAPVASHPLIALVVFAAVLLLLIPRVRRAIFRLPSREYRKIV